MRNSDVEDVLSAKDVAKDPLLMKEAHSRWVVRKRSKEEDGKKGGHHN